MCGVVNCPLAFRETLALRQIVEELTEGDLYNDMAVKMDVGRLLHDVAVAIGLDPWAVLNPAIMCRILDEDVTRLWPTLTEAENAELVDLASIRETVESDEISPVTGRDEWINVRLGYAHLDGSVA